MELDKHIRDNAARRESFMALAERVFGLSFREWYAGGWWSERYRPYVLAHGDRVLACIAVNVMDTAWRGKDRRYIQLGTVMTDPACRGQGLSRRLMEAVLADWEDACDGIYLFANETVLEFYPRFGFERAAEYEWTLPVRQEAGPCRRLDMDSARRQGAAAPGVPIGEAPTPRYPARNNFGLLMFYAGSVYKEAVYYMEDWDMAAVAARNEGRLICLDVFGGRAGSPGRGAGPPGTREGGRDPRVRAAGRDGGRRPSAGRGRRAVRAAGEGEPAAGGAAAVPGPVPCVRTAKNRRGSNSSAAVFCIIRSFRWRWGRSRCCSAAAGGRAPGPPRKRRRRSPAAPVWSPTTGARTAQS